MARYQSGAATYSTNLGGITDLNVNLGTETASDDSGAIYDETRSIVRQYPTIELTTKAIAGSINLWGIPGTCIDGTPPLICYGNVLGDCKSPPLSTDNAKFTVNVGHIRIGSLSAARGEDATLTWMVDALTDGTNEPIAPDYAGNTLPTSLATGQWTLGAIKIGALVLSDIASITLDFGVQMTSKTPMLGSVWPDSIAVRKVQPTLTIQVFDIRFWESAVIPTLGLAATHANTLIQLKKRANLTTFVADNVETHVSFTMGGIITVTQPFAGSSNGEASGTIVVQGVHDGTNVPVIADTTAPYDPTP
jgi:hypothetical protein